MRFLINHTIFVALVAALAVASLPFASASAWGPGDSIPQWQITNERLEKIWARQVRRYERIGHADTLIARVQRLIDRANANGTDVSAVHATLDAFAAQWKKAKPVYEGMKGIVNSHQGFDSNGKVTDPEKAKQTLVAMHAKFQETKIILSGTGKALRDAMQVYRQTNPRPQPTTTP